MLSEFDGQKRKNNIEENQYVVFVVFDEEFGVNIKQTREIININELTYIPDAPDFVNGVFNLRGEIVPIIDLNKRLFQREDDEHSEHKTIIVEMEGNLIGMQVRDVKGIIRLNEEDIGKAPKITRSINKDYISGVGKLENRLLVLLNLRRVLSVEEIGKLNELEM